MNGKVDYLAISREIAYKGKIGHMRKDFCISYIKHKQEVIKGIENTQVTMVYRILTYGLIGMPDIPGRESLPRKFMNDPEVSPILQKYLKA